MPVNLQQLQKSITTLSRTINALTASAQPKRSIDMLRNSRHDVQILNVMVPLNGHAFIARGAYDFNTKEFFIEFNRGGQYVYDNVPRRVWQEFARRARAGVDAGKYYNEIKNDYGPGMKVSSGEMREAVASVGTNPSQKSDFGLAAPKSQTTPMLPALGNTRNERIGIEAMRTGETYKPPVTDGLKITKNYRVRNFRKVQNVDGSVEAVFDIKDALEAIKYSPCIDVQDGAEFDLKEANVVVKQLVEQSTGPAAAVKAMNVIPMDASSPITELVDFPESNLPKVARTTYVSDVIESPADIAAISAVAPASTTPENTSLADMVAYATNQRTMNAAKEDNSLLEMLVVNPFKVYHYENENDPVFVK
jgi:hypothetical protein